MVIFVYLAHTADKINNGERMYRKAITLRDMKDKNIKEKKNNIKKEQDKECTFRPKINDSKFINV
jgi:hypothetical protein